jgi:hypothetical protein
MGRLSRDRQRLGKTYAPIELPSRLMPSMVGCNDSFITRFIICGVATGAGEYAPMPPVFGPVSPSPILLWSWAAGRGTIVYPSENASTDISGPTRYSSITISLPKLRNCQKSPPRFNKASDLHRRKCGRLEYLLNPSRLLQVSLGGVRPFRQPSH